MSKEVATQDKAKAPLVAKGRNVGAIVPENIEQAFRLSQAIVAANMAPKAYNRDANAVMVGIMHGMEVGLTPMAALQSIAVINGMPTIWGDGMLGLVRSSGLLEDFNEFTEGEGDQAEAVCICRRRGQTSDIRRTFSVADAKKAGLWGKAGPWTQYPQRMMQMRARSWALRDGFADVLRGLASAEEMRDMGALYQAADGTYVPEGRPLRAHYAEQAAKKQAEADERRMDDEYRAITTDRMPDDTPDQGRADEGNEAPAETATPVSTPGPAPKEPGDKRADSAGQLPLDQADGAVRVPLVDEHGQEIGSYERADHYFNALKKKAVESSDPEAFLHANQAGANVFVQRDEGYIARWNECQEAAYQAQDAMNATA